jgi:hypothetical protein
MTGNRCTANSLADTIKDTFSTCPLSQLAFTIGYIAEAIWKKPSLAQEALVSYHLTAARRIFEDKENDSFIPVTDYYFENYTDRRQPKSRDEAKLCIAGWGIGQYTVGIRRMRAKHPGSNDWLTNLWLERLKITACAAGHRFAARVGIAYNNGAITKELATRHLQEGGLILLPDDRVTLRKLMPKSFDGIQIKLTGNGKSLKNLQVTKE